MGQAVSRVVVVFSLTMAILSIQVGRQAKLAAESKQLHDFQSKAATTCQRVVRGYDDTHTSLP